MRPGFMSWSSQYFTPEAFKTVADRDGPSVGGRPVALISNIGVAPSAGFHLSFTRPPVCMTFFGLEQLLFCYLERKDVFHAIEMAIK